MTIARAWVRSYAVPLPSPWPSAEGDVDKRVGSILLLEDEDGFVGHGETAPWPGFGLETHPSSFAALRLAARRLMGLPASAYLATAARLEEMAQVAAAPCARHAIDLALHDLAAQRAGLSVARLLGEARARSAVQVNHAISRLPAEEAARAAQEAARSGAGTIKLKVGGRNLPEDLERIRAVRDAVGPDIRIRIDANQAWNEGEAVEALRKLAAYEIEYCEQPVAAGSIEGMARVRAASAIPIAADESVRDVVTAREILDRGAADVLVLKPMALGGLHAAGRIVALARERGVEVVVTSLLESEIGRAGSLHLAASLGETRFAHGVATGVSPFAGIAPIVPGATGAISVPQGPGIGVGLEAPRGTAELVAALEDDE